MVLPKMMMMFKSLHHLKLTPIISPTFQFPFSLHFCTSISHPHSFSLSYLINNLGLSSETAFELSKRCPFKTSQKPDSVIAFFKNHGFSDSQVITVLTKRPQLLLCNPHKFVLPKFQFLASKGASTSHIVLAVTKNPDFLCSSLKNNIIPTFELMIEFFQSDKKALNYFISRPELFRKKCTMQNLKLLRDAGVRDAKIASLFQMRVPVVQSPGLRKAVDEVKELGFDPLKWTFVMALVAKVILSEPKWNAKVDALKSWGWSKELIDAAFKRHPRCMLASVDKINAVLSFWVNRLGWNSLDLAMFPVVFGYSLEKRIVPRASVVQYLLTKGLIKKNASLYSPLVMSEKLFLEKYVEVFEEESFQLLKIYHGEKELNFHGMRED